MSIHFNVIAIQCYAVHCILLIVWHLSYELITMNLH